MDLTKILEMGGELIKNNSDDATTGLDVQQIAGALSGLLGNSEGGLDISSLVAQLASNEAVGSMLGSWLGSGENASISTDQVTEILGSDKISEFASTLGLSTESAKGALADALPQMIDNATSGDAGSMFDDMLGEMGGSKGAMDTLGKLFG